MIYGLSQRIYRETPSGAVNGSNKTFTLAFTPVLGSEEFYWNGQLMTSGNDYTISGATITVITSFAPATNDVLRVSYDRL